MMTIEEKIETDVIVLRKINIEGDEIVTATMIVDADARERPKGSAGTTRQRSSESLWRPLSARAP